MQFNTFVASPADLKRCAQAPQLQEVLLEPALLARQGTLTEDQVASLAATAAEAGLRPVLVWDLLMPERVMARICEYLQHWDLKRYAAVRVCDPGAAYWLQTHYPKLPLQLIVETGNHNLEALQGWCEIFAGSLERLVLSIELPEAKLVEYCQTLPVACELLGVGPILLFYSPRSLLAVPLAADVKTDAPYLEATATFADAPNRPFPALETVHGTFLFLDRDQFILDRLAKLELAGLHIVRLDLRHLGQGGNVAVDVDCICREILEDPASLRDRWPRQTRAPFFNANRTTALFPRLQAKPAAYRNQDCLAEVLTGESGKYVVFQTLCPFTADQIQNMVMPTGEIVGLPSDLNFRTLTGEPLSSFESEQLLVTDWIKKAVPGSFLIGRIALTPGPQP